MNKFYVILFFRKVASVGGEKVQIDTRASDDYHSDWEDSNGCALKNKRIERVTALIIENSRRQLHELPKLPAKYTGLVSLCY